MSRKRCIRKVYMLPKGMTPLEYAQKQASLLTTAEWNDQMVPVIRSIEALSRGEWDNATWNALFYALNRIESMTKLKRVDVTEWIEECQQVFVNALGRRDKTGATAFKADELAKIREIGQVYGDLLKEVTHKFFHQACDHTEANVNRIIKQKGSGVKDVHGCLIERP